MESEELTDDREAQTAIDVTNATVRFATDQGEITALQDLSVRIGGGQLVTVIGPSGCGKSTLLRLIADLLAPSAGRVAVFGAPPDHARRDRRLGFVFQDAALLPWRTAIRNVELPLEVGSGVTRNRPHRNPGELLDLVGLNGRHNAYPQQLSGGMRQRVSIARALVTQPQILLMDEPFGALDAITRGRLNVELLSIWAKTATTIVFVTHSIDEAVFLGQRVVVMSANPGRVHAEIDVPIGYPRPPELREDPEYVAIAAQVRRALETA